ncbi:hypothetical protein Dsin_005943 [Dipteronia sinensis]|uniref:Uncharacterized protein n=1 Tax=Dipteronia sinensis TaxID=43782 RepID=A0AAE0AXJ6_9ROSI|nr:hypothetical protein Dsin_005943 [Dipteronia sinensis]
MFIYLCKRKAFASGLVFNYKLAEKAILSVFITFFTDYETTYDLRKAAMYANFQEGLLALLVIVMFYISQDCGHPKRIIFCLIVNYACVDHGEKKTGLATLQIGSTFAKSLDVINATTSVEEFDLKLKEYVVKYIIDAIVIGDPKPPKKYLVIPNHPFLIVGSMT